MVWSSECLLIYTLSHPKLWATKTYEAITICTQWLPCPKEFGGDEGQAHLSKEINSQLHSYRHKLKGMGSTGDHALGSAVFLGAKTKPPFQTAVILAQPVPYTKASGNRRKARRTLPRASSQRSSGESSAPFKSGRYSDKKLVVCVWWKPE